MTAGCGVVDGQHELNKHGHQQSAHLNAQGYQKEAG